MLAVVAMASCSKSELTPRPEVAGDVEIKAGSSVLSIDTKAPYTGELTNTGDLLDAYVYAYKVVTPMVYTTSYADGYMTFKNTGSGVPAVGFLKADGSANSKYYPADNSSLELVAFAPVNKTASEVWTNASGAVSAVIDGKTDLMAARVDAMDVTPAPTPAHAINKKNAQKDEHPKFTFDHLLTRVNVKAYAFDQAAKDAWGDITEIKLVKVIDADVNNKVSVAVANLTPAFSKDAAAAATSLYAYDATAATDKYTDKEIGGTADATHFGNIVLHVGNTTSDPAPMVAYSIIAPFEYPAATPKKTLYFEIKTTKVTTAKEVQIGTLYTAYTDDTNFTEFTAGTSTKGYEFDIVLNFKATEITASATVNPWQNGGDTGKDFVVD